MSEKEYQKGDTLYQDGDRSDAIYRVEEGSIEILKLISDRMEVVGTAKKGDFVGEIASLISRNRSTSARVAENGTWLRSFEKAEFLRLVSYDPDNAYNLLNRICERLHASSRRSTDDAVHQVIRTAKGQDESSKLVSSVLETTHDVQLTIFPGSDFLAGQMPREGIIFNDSPYIVGRKEEEDSPESAKPKNWLTRRKDRRGDGERRKNVNSTKVHLQLSDSQPFRLSRIHFLIQKMPDGGFIVRDLGSTLGTQVNETSLGSDFPSDFVGLQMGENIISAGGNDSSHKFRVVIAPL